MKKNIKDETSRVISFRLSKLDLDSLSERIDAMNLTISDYIRLLIRDAVNENI